MKGLAFKIDRYWSLRHGTRFHGHLHIDILSGVTSRNWFNKLRVFRKRKSVTKEGMDATQYEGFDADA